MSHEPTIPKEDRSVFKNVPYRKIMNICQDKTEYLTLLIFNRNIEVIKVEACTVERLLDTAFLCLFRKKGCILSHFLGAKFVYT